MATFLYKLGKWCSHHHWRVITAWALLLALITGAAVALMKPMTTKIEIPGTSFQRVLNDLRTSIPAAAGGNGTIVITSDKPFTEDQKKAVAQAAASWSKVDGVTAVRDPFVTQSDIDATPNKLAAGKAQLESGKAQLAEGEKKLAEGQAQLDAGQKLYDENAAKIQAAADQISQGDAQIAQLTQAIEQAKAGGMPATQLEAQLRAAEVQLAPAKRQYEAGKAQLDEAKGKLAAGKTAIEANRSQVEQGKTQLTAAEAKLTAGQRQYDLAKDFRLVTADNKAAMAAVHFKDDITAVPLSVRSQITDHADNLRAAGLTVEFDSWLTMNITSLVGPGEIVGVVLAGIVLLIALGSLIAAGLPLLMALVGVGVGIGGTMILTHWIELYNITPVLGLMLGLAVGIDYSLFIVNRHRGQLLAGSAVHESAGRATGTSGNAVAFAGLTVVIALTALAITGIPFLGVMGYVAAFTVALAVLVAVTLTPAVLGLVGKRVVSKKAWRRAGFGDHGEPREGAGISYDEELAGGAHGRHGRDRRGWGGLVTAHPWLAGIGAALVLGLLAIPAASLRLGLPDGGSEPADSTAYRAYHQVAQHFGAGANGPIMAVARMSKADPSGNVSLDVAERLAKVDGVVKVLPIGNSDDGTMAAFQVVPAQGPAHEQTVQAIDAMRAAAPGINAQTGAEVEFTGATVANIDISAKLSEALPKYLVVVVGLSLLILLLVFRSVLVPLIATGGFLLSLAGSFGAVVAVYQWGWLANIFGVSSPTPVLSFLPTILIGVLFGLAMDYQMFLVTGMREAHQHGEEARAAVLSGYRHGARVVAAAAIIMTSVFAGFIFAHLTMVRPIGFGLAIGVALDAFLVRMTLTPAVMNLLGEKAWWLPKWLDRLLPDVDVEGVKLLDHLDHPVAAVGNGGRHRKN